MTVRRGGGHYVIEMLSRPEKETCAIPPPPWSQRFFPEPGHNITEKLSHPEKETCVTPEKETCATP